MANDKLARRVRVTPEVAVRQLVHEEHVAQHLVDGLAIAGLAFQLLIEISFARLVLELDQVTSVSLVNYGERNYETYAY